MKKSSRLRTRSWLIHHLLDSNFHERVANIEALTRTVCWAPKTTFKTQHNHLVQVQEFVPHGSERPQRQHIVSLANKLDAELNFVHGDLCRKNMIFDGQQLWVIDWEPSLYQFRKGAKHS